MKPPRILVLGTGGTIAGAAASATSSAYRPGGLALTAMLADLAALGLDAELVGEEIARIGSHQARSVTGTVQLPLSAISPVRQGTTPMFVPLAHVTLEGEGLRAMSRSFVIGPRSASGRLHPILLDQPPGGIAGLVAQAIAIPPATAAA